MRLDLNDGWEVRFEGMEKSAADWVVIERRTEGWMPCSLPCDVRVPLIEAGIIREPLDEMNCYDSEWIEDRSWWFRKRLSMDAGLLRQAAECRLRFEMLDVHADIFLNGRLVGHHSSAFYPFEIDVRELLLPGANVLGVRLTTGLERVRDEDFAGYSTCIATEALAGRGTRGDKRRALLRKPQYVFGWDWGPRAATCAIAGDASLTMVGMLRVESLRAVTRSIEGSTARLDICVEAENTHPWSTAEGRVSVEVSDGGKVVAKASSDLLLRSGINHVDFDLAVPEAKLWWPNGHGEQALYTVTAAVLSGGPAGEYAPVDTAFARIGIRTVQLDQTPEFGGRRFALVVNGVTVHCKGSDWIPADSLYARVTAAKYRKLVEEAKTANFTMLRIWGGGRYESDTFYDACDEAGILIWHDFMFACAIYPDNEDWFREEVRREAEYQTRRLRNHPSLALWCGSNENSWGFVDWWNGGKNPKAPFWGGARLYNYILPETVRKNCPEIPYWNGSPYGGEHPNGNDAGDRHHWVEAMMSPNVEDRIVPEAYDKVEARFITEYGYVGPCIPQSIARYHAGKPVDRTGPVYLHHSNTFEKETVIAGIRKHYRDPEGMTNDQYFLYAALVQGLMYGYSLESLRSSPRNSGSLFWMYADCWGEVGWTIVDYYLKRKPSWYFVRRAFMTHRLILRVRNGDIEATGINDTPADYACWIEYGSTRLDGAGSSVKEAKLTLPARSRGVVLSFPVHPADPRESLEFVRPLDAGEALLPAILRQVEHRHLRMVDPGLEVTETARGKERELTVRAKAFAHAVHFSLGDDGEASDEYFDLLPGESRRIVVTGRTGAGPISARSVRP
ncbi:MAG TPA: glycoside hydrolase family 2 protein [Spirochaetia bacterium]|nr:glycoside hydrolase family 2 protein [Spirochaetia bacterium]